MSEKIDMSKKYQEYYNQIIVSTLSETLITGISYQANVKLANDVIAENEANIKALNEKINALNAELSMNQNTNDRIQNEKLANSENIIKDQQQTILKLNNLVDELNRFRIEHETLRQKSINSDITCNELTKECDTHKRTISDQKTEIEKLNSQLAEANKLLGMSPAKRKKYIEEQETSNKQEPPKVEVKSVQMNEPPVVKKSTELIEKRRVEMSQKRQKNGTVEDGGNF